MSDIRTVYVEIDSREPVKKTWYKVLVDSDVEWLVPFQDVAIGEVVLEVDHPIVKQLKAENQRLRKAGIAALDGLLYAVRDLDRIDISLGAEALACCNGYEGGINAFHVFEYVKPELRGKD